MLNLNSILIGSAQPKVMGDFYQKVFDKDPEMSEEGQWYGWLVGSSFISIGAHSEIKGQAKEPGRMMFNFETSDVKGEFERIKAIGATVVKEPYTMPEGPEMWIATFADPDGNYFQLMSPWKANK